MTRTLIANARIFDATGAEPFTGDVLIVDNTITSISRTPGALNLADAQTIDAAGRFLMPGMTEGHAHLSFDDLTQTEDLINPSPEAHALITARGAKKLLDAGFTSAYSASEAKLRLAVAVRDEVNAGHIPGPRIRAGSLEITVTGAMGDEGKEHNPRQGISRIINGPEDMRLAVREFCREGCDNIKLDISGDPFYPNTPADFTPMAYDEVKMAVDVAHSFGRMVNAHTRSVLGTKYAVRAGADVIYHVEYSDNEMLDMLEEAKDRVFIAPSFGLLYTMMHEGDAFGITREVATAMGIADLVEASAATHTALRKRGIRHLIGGDYGIAWNPQGTNARDLKYFVDYYGYSPADALLCATRNGGLVMRGQGPLGTIQEGSLADILLIDGDPLHDISIMADKDKIALIMKDGAIHKNETATVARWAAAE